VPALRLMNGPAEVSEVGALRVVAVLEAVAQETIEADGLLGQAQRHDEWRALPPAETDADRRDRHGVSEVVHLDSQRIATDVRPRGDIGLEYHQWNQPPGLAGRRVGHGRACQPSGCLELKPEA
jgi:hypothetical protein